MLRALAAGVKPPSMQRNPAAALPAPPSRTPVLVVDDHPMVRECLAAAIAEEPDLVVCGEADDRQGAIAMAERLRPQVAIVDLQLKDSHGLDVIKDFHARFPEVRLLVVSMFEESLYAERALRAGAHGYITKQEATKDILKALRTVLAGQVYLNAAVASQILGQLSGHPRQTSPGLPVDFLSDRELQVLELTGRGFQTKEIAGTLGISTKTVDTYRCRVRERLGLPDQGEFLRFALAWARDREEGGPR